MRYLFFTFLMILLSCNSKQEIDLIVTNAEIYTVDSSYQIVDAFAVKDGKFVFVGDDKTVESKYVAKENLDLDGKFVYPGFIDAHCHFVGYGIDLVTKANLVGTKSYQEIIDRLKEFDKAHPNNDWVLGRGWDQNDWEVKSFPTKALLDEAFPDKPVFLKRIDGHAALINSNALNMIGLTENSNISGGEILKQNGEPTGVLIDNAIDLVNNIIPKVDRPTQIAGILAAQDSCFKVGLTSVHDAGLDKDMVLLIDSLQKADLLKMNIYAMLNPTNENFDYFLKNGIYETEKLTVRSIKIYADGALGSRGAKLIEPYTDDPHNHGLLLTSIDSMKSYAMTAAKNGYQVCTHAIGDQGNRIVLDIYASLLKSKNDKRWRIEHAQVVNVEDFEKFGNFNIIPSVQPTHATSDMYWATDRLGEERVQGAYAYKDLMNQNGWIPLGSDFPVEHINPIFGYYAATSRQDQQAFPEGGFQIKNALTNKEALQGMTIWAAKSGFEDKKMGSIEVNKAANFVITEKNMTKITIDKVCKINVLYTFMNGKNML